MEESSVSKEIITYGTEPVSLMPSSELGRMSIDSKPTFTLSDEEEYEEESVKIHIPDAESGEDSHEYHSTKNQSSEGEKKKKREKKKRHKEGEMEVEEDLENGAEKKKGKKKKNRFLSFLEKLCCSSEGYVYALLKLNFFMRALKFIPALLITYGIELFNSANLGNNQAILLNHFSLLIFVPVLSAIAGNIGLQTSSSVSAYINLQVQNKKKSSS